MSKAGSHVVNVAVGVWSWGRSFLRKRRPEGRNTPEPSFDGRAERALRFLVEAGEVLATSLDYEVTLQRIANLAVPDLADWCAVRILDDEGEFQPVALAFADPVRRALAEDLFRLYPPPRDATHGPGEVVRSRRPYFQPEVTDEMQAAGAQNAEHLRLIRAVGCRSYLCVPMEADGRLLGTLSWIISEPNRRFSEADLTVAKDLAHRAALAVRSSRLYREAQDAISRLEQSQALSNALLAAAPFGVALLDRDLKYLRINNLLSEWNGQTPEAHVGRSVQEVLGTVGTRFEPLLRQVIETHQPLVNWEYEARAPGRPESLRHWSSTYYPALSESGEVLGVGALVADITERRVASERLAESLAQVEALIEGAPFAITLLDRDLRYVQINETMASIHGKPVSEYLGRTFREVLPEAAGQFEAELREVVETGRPKLNRFFEGRVPAQPGKRGRWVGNWFPVRTLDGQVLGVGVIAMEITEQMRVEEALRQSERRYRTLTDAVVQLMWANDADGNTLFVNRRWEDFSGLTPDDVLKSGWLRLVYPDDLTRILDLRSRAIAEGKPYEMEYRLRARDGSYRWHIIRTVPIRDAAGHLEGWFGTATDIHDLKSAETSLQTARDAAEAASQAKSQFLAVLSHELRNPLAPALIAVASLLDNPQTPDALRPSLEVARRNIELETRLIDDLLDVTRIAQGKLLMDRVPVDAHELIQRAVEICRDDINLKNLAIHVNLDAVNPRIEADPARFQQIIWNLLKNAAKYTPAQGSIRVRTWNPEEEPSVLAVEVQDTGRGIEASALPRIFDAFEQADPRVTRQFGGLGLGLAISRSLAEALEGTLQARSPGLNQGSTFTLRLPTTIRPSSEPDASDDANDAGAGPLAILLVEDNPDSLNLLTRLLKSRGHHVRPASSLAEARKAIEEGPVDVVVSDIGLPDGSGLELLHPIRDQIRRGAIALSGFGTDTDRLRSREAGFDIHLTKPIDFARLQAAIAKVVQTDGTRPDASYFAV